MRHETPRRRRARPAPRVREQRRQRRARHSTRQNGDPPQALCQLVLRGQAPRHSKPSTVRARQKQRRNRRCRLPDRSVPEHGALVPRAAPTERQGQERRQGVRFGVGAARTTMARLERRSSRLEYCGAAPQSASVVQLLRVVVVVTVPHCAWALPTSRTSTPRCIKRDAQNAAGMPNAWGRLCSPAERSCS